MCSSTSSHQILRKSCFSQNFPSEAISAAELSHQASSSADFYSSSPSLLRICGVFFTPRMNSAFLLPSICAATSLSSSVCFCRSVCLDLLTPSSLPSPDCSSWLPESQPLLSMPHYTHSHPLNKVRWKEERRGERRGGRDEGRENR